MHYINYFRRLWNGVAWISNKTGYSKLYFFVDGLIASLRYGVNVSGYVKDGMWKQPSFVRRYEVTPRKIWKAIYHFNDKAYTHFFLNKADFNKHFASVVKRDWILMNETSFEKFLTFYKTHDYLFILKSATKPLNVLIAFTRPLITEFADNLNLKHPLLPTISPYPTM